MLEGTLRHQVSVTLVVSLRMQTTKRAVAIEYIQVALLAALASATAPVALLIGQPAMVLKP